MKRTTFLLVLLFYFNVGCFSNPIAEDLDKIRYWVYKYEGQIEARNSASNETLSRWTVSGKLSAYNSLKHVIVKLDNVKTSLFNGERDHLKNVHEKEIPLDSKALLEPFKLRKEGDDYYIYFEPNDPLWSRNFKRGIASNLDFDVSKLDDSDNKNKIFKERSIHGLCEVSYSVQEDDAKITVYQKIINHNSCTELPQKQITNILGKATNVKDFEKQRTKTIKTATFRADEKGILIPFELVSTSNIIIRTMPNSITSQHLDQHQKLELVEHSEVTDEPDISEATDRHDLIYEASFEPTLGRHVFEKDTDALVKLYLDNYNSFTEFFTESPVENINWNNRDQIDNMFLALFYMKAEDFGVLEEAFRYNKNYTDVDGEYFEYDRIRDFYYSLLPYVGTDEFVKYLISYIDYKDEFGFNNWGRRELSAARILATFPNFLQNPTEKMLKDLEILLNIQHMTQRSAKNAGVLSFASVVAQVYKKHPSSKDNLNKYIELYHGKFLQSENYEERMTYLLGLVNMADMLDVDVINNIITNTSESKHIRTLAITGFKTKLSQEDTKTKHMFKTYWPIVQNKKESFEVRVAALDFLLSLKLNDEQFNTIIKKYSLHFNDPQERHLANYLLTSLHSLQNTTEFFDNLGAQCSEALKNNQIPFFPKSYTTGNYRIAHTDEDIGSYLQARLTTDPSTNAFKVAQISHKTYGFSYNIAEFNLYLKVDGLMESLYAEFFLKNVKNVSSVPELVKMLKEGNFDIKEINRDIHVDVAVFYNDVAVYSAHFEKWDRRELHQIANDLEQFMDEKFYAKYPMVDYKHIPSDLGTPLQISHLIEDIYFLNFLFDILHYRSSSSYQTWIESYNPLVDTNIASYKYIGVEKLIKFNHTLDSKKMQLSWITTNDSIVINWDNTVGTSVESEETLKQYCEDCSSYIQPDFKVNLYETKDIESLGLKLNSSISTTDGDVPRGALITLLHDEKYESNYDASPYTGPMMFFYHFLSRKLLFYNELSSGSYNFQPYYNEDIESTANWNYDGSIKKLLNPMIKKDYEFEVEVKHKLVDSDKALSGWNYGIYYAWDPEYKNETGGKNVVLTQKVNFNYISSNKSESTTTHICLKKQIFFPSIKSDKYSLEAVQPTIGKLVYKVSEEENDKTCEDPRKEVAVEETYWSTDKTEKLQDKQNKKDYEECLQNSKDLSFVEPSSACRRISSKLAEYDNYQLFLTEKNLTKGHESENKVSKPVLQYNRPEKDYIQLALLSYPLAHEDPYMNTTFYYPKVLINPTSLLYADYDYGLPFLSTSTCTISPSTVELFSGKFVPHQEEKWTAFGECFNKTTRGLKGRSVDNHVEFDYYSRENTLNVGYKDGKAQLQLNGKELHESYKSDSNSDDIKVYFVAENVFYVFDNSVTIYYNTEYVQIKINSLHSKLLCGLCTKDQ